MLRGVFRHSGGPAIELPAARGMAQGGGSIWTSEDGRLALAGAAPWERASADGVACGLEGRLHDRDLLVRTLGPPAGEGQGDAELVARAYRAAGAAALRALRGRFAAALWDGQRREGLLSCDLLATQSLFYWRGPGYLAFAGELPDLLAILPSRPGPDADAFLSWLGGWSVPEDRTLFEGVGRLAPGELIELSGEPRLRTHWRPEYTGVAEGTRSELAEGLREQLERAVARRLSPRSSGVVLSGGLDSSIVTAVAAEVRRPGSRLDTYSSAFPGAEYDESWKVRSLTESLGIEPRLFELEPRGGLWHCLRRLERWGLPLTTNAVLIDVAMVDAAAADGVEVMLDGQTGDELFGHSPWVLADRLMRGRLPSALGIASRWPAPERPITGREQLRLLRTWGLKGAAPYRLHRLMRSRKDPDRLAPAWMLPAHRPRYAELEDHWAWKAGGDGPRWWRYQVDLIVREPHRLFRLDNLRQRAADAGVVGETPLYDVDLIEFCLRLPPELAFDWAHSRPLAREAVRGMIPDDVRLNSCKAVFSPFCFEMIAGADAPGIERLLGDPAAELGAFADLERVREMWHAGRPRQGPRYATLSWGSTIWRLTAAEAWLRHQADPDFAVGMLADPDVVPPRAHPLAEAAV